MSKEVIYAAGNPDAYPIEYYDKDTESYQGLIPQLLAQFAEEHGCELRYYDDGEKDQREQLAQNRQVDIISGCVGTEQFSHTEKEKLVVLKSEQNGETVTYALMVSDVAPKDLNRELKSFLSGISQETKTGMLVESAADRTDGWEVAVPALISLALVIVFLFAALAAVIRKYRRRLKSMELSREVDGVTGLGNLEYLRRCFDGFLNDKNRILYTMFYFYEDTEKMENRSGRAETREFIRYTASVLQEYTSDTDILARVGEHGFALLRQSAGREEEEQWFQPILPRIQDFAREQGISAGIAAGIYSLKADDRDLNVILSNAGQSAQIAYKAKEPYKLCTDEVLRRFAEEQRLQSEIRKGLEREEFQLYIQFYVDAHTYRIVGGEALSRWEHPQRGLLYPGQYIPLMEREELIDRLDYYTLDKVCRLLEDLQNTGIEDFFISCNFSRGTFSAEDFACRCEEVIKKYRFPRELLIFEITESYAVKNADVMKRNIKAIKEMGVSIALDDFGEGFTSFFDIQEYPLDGLKLDKQLIDNLGTNPGDSILRAMIWVGHQLGMTVLAEGVETEDQLRLLQEMACDVLQGYYFHHPIPDRDAEEKLKNTLN